jgi:hypothetical protein
MEWSGDCMWCGAPEAEAPSLLAPFDDTHTNTYFVRQPATPEEVDQAISAAPVCCVFAIRYGGQDRSIIARLGNDPAMCDYILSEAGALQRTISDDGNLLPYAKAIVDAKHGALQVFGHKLPKKWWQFWR